MKGKANSISSPSWNSRQTAVERINDDSQAEMESLFKFAKSNFDIKLRADDDVVDRLNHFHTGLLLVVSSVVLSTYGFVLGKAMYCWNLRGFTLEQMPFIQVIASTW